MCSGSFYHSKMADFLSPVTLSSADIYSVSPGLSNQNQQTEMLRDWSLFMAYTGLGKIDPGPRNFLSLFARAMKFIQPKRYGSRIFFPFVDTTVAGKLHFRYKMHVETCTHDVRFTKILHVCSNHDILASALFRVTSCLHTVKLPPVPLLFHCTVI